MALDFIKEKIHDIGAAFVKIQVLSNSFRPKEFTWTTRHAPAAINKLYVTTHAFPQVHAIAVSWWSVSLSNRCKAMFERKIVVHVKDNKKSFDVYVKLNAHNYNKSLLVSTHQENFTPFSFHSANEFAAYVATVFHLK